MSNPDGTRTRDEHRSEIVKRTNAYIKTGMTADDALTKASTDWHVFLEQEGQRKIALVMKFLGVRATEKGEPT